MSHQQTNPDTRPLPPGWISQFDANYRAWYYVDTTATPPKTFWQHPADLAPPPPPSYAPPSASPPGGALNSSHGGGSAMSGGGVGGFAFPTPQSADDGKIPTYGGNTSFVDQQVYQAKPGSAEHRPANVGAQYSGAPTTPFDTTAPSTVPSYGQSPGPYQSHNQYGQQQPGQYGQPVTTPGGSQGDRGLMGGIVGGLMGAAAGKHGGGKMGKLGALAGLVGGKHGSSSHGSGSSSPFGKFAGMMGGSHGGSSHGHGGGYGYGAAPMMYGKPHKAYGKPPKKHGGGGAGMMAAGAGAGLLGGLLVADAVGDTFDGNDYGGGDFGGGDFGDFGGDF